MKLLSVAAPSVLVFATAVQSTFNHHDAPHGTDDFISDNATQVSRHLGWLTPLLFTEGSVKTKEDGDNHHESLPPPERILREYMAWHSVEALQRDTPEQRAARKYIVTGFDCPHQAGNVLTFYINSLVLAMATNRTLVVRYTGSPPEERKCYRILERATWMPSLDDAGFGEQDEKQVIRMATILDQDCGSVFGTRGVTCGNKTHSLQTNPELISRIGHDIGDRIVYLRALGGCPFTKHHQGYGWRYDLSDDLCLTFVQNSFPNEMQPKSWLDQLFSQGVDFLYGMALHHSFKFTQELLESVVLEPEGARLDPEAYSFGIHSRHINGEDDGSELKEQELKCIDDMIQRYKESKMRDGNAKMKCQVLVMADRSLFRAAVQKHIAGSGCTMLAVDHSRSGGRRLGAIKGEHGPFEGAGYFRDYAFVLHARNGFVGLSGSTSSLLPLLTFTYERFMQSWNTPTEKQDEFLVCLHH